MLQGFGQDSVHDYLINVKDGDRWVYRNDPHVGDIGGPNSVTETLALLNRTLELDFILRGERGKVSAYGAKDLQLLLGIGLAVLSVLLRYHDRAQVKETERVQAISELLKQEVTARKAIAAELETSIHELAQSNEELESFAYVASHDLQEPLRKIRTFSKRLQDRCGDQVDERGQDYIERMTAAATRMSGLIEDLLSYSRVSTRSNPFENVSLTTLLNETLGDFEVSIEESNAKISSTPLPTVKVDASQIKQIFSNLISNALKFQPDGQVPEIHIDHEQISDDTGTWDRIRVSDNGIGIAPEYQEKIFNPFTRLHSRTEFPGSGIGLSICEKIMERHEGRISVEKESQSGTIFYLDFPAR